MVGRSLSRAREWLPVSLCSIFSLGLRAPGPSKARGALEPAASGTEVQLSLNNQAPGNLLGLTPEWCLLGVARKWVPAEVWGESWEDQEVEDKER